MNKVSHTFENTSTNQSLPIESLLKELDTLKSALRFQDQKMRYLKLQFSQRALDNPSSFDPSSVPWGGIGEDEEILFQVEQDLSKIEYIKTERNYCLIYRKGGEVEVVRIPLKKIISYFSQRDLVQVHRCYVVNTSLVCRIRKCKRTWSLTLKQSDSCIPISASHLLPLQKYFPNAFLESPRVSRYS